MKKFVLLIALSLAWTSLFGPAVSAAPSASPGPSETSASDSSSGGSASSEGSGASGGADSSGDESSGGSSQSSGGGSTDAGTGVSGGAAAEGGKPKNGASMTLPPPPNANEFYSRAFYMKNLDSNTVVYQQNDQERIAPASLTKIMTCLIALENVEDLDKEITTLKPYIQNYLYNLRVDTLGGIYLGEELCIRDLLYAMMIQSANEAAMMVADYVGDGNMDYFIELMNAKAKSLGAVNTHFANATGLEDEQNYSTAYDMGLIAEEAIKNPEFMEIVTTLRYTSKPTSRHEEGITWTSTNYMQNPANTNYYYEGLKGIKTGTLQEPENIHNFVSMATRDGYSYLLVVMGAPIYNPETGKQFERNLAMVDSRVLYNWAFETFKVETLMDVGKEVTEVGVRLSWDTDHVKLLAKEKFATLVTTGTTENDLENICEYYNATPRPVKGAKGETMYYIDAPIRKNQEVGYVRLMLAGEEVGRVTLVAAEDVERSDWLYYLDEAKKFLSTFVFKFVVTLIVVLIVLYIILMIIRNHNRKRYRVRRRTTPTGRPKNRRQPPKSASRKSRAEAGKSKTEKRREK